MRTNTPDEDQRRQFRAGNASYDPRTWSIGSDGQSPDKQRRPAVARARLLQVAVAIVAFVALLYLAYALLRPFNTRSLPQPASAHATNELYSTQTVSLQTAADLQALLQDSATDQIETAKVMKAAQPSFASGRRLLCKISASIGADKRRHIRLISLEQPDGTGISLALSRSAVTATPILGHLVQQVRTIRGEMDGNSFYSSALAAGLDASVIPDMTSSLAFDFDFVREIHAGDVFEAVLADQANSHGDVVGARTLLFVSIATASKSLALYRFQVPGEKGAGWFDANGRSARRTLMRTPVDGAHVTSNFGMRIHPVLGFTMMHKGIDFGAPVGTPVYASGDGTISSMGPRGTYGLYLRIDHSPELATAYAHLSRFADGLATGSHVSQGQVVAFTGATGRVTGPHLHYEVLVKGEQVDPLGLELTPGTQLSSRLLSQFLAMRKKVDEMRVRD